MRTVRTNKGELINKLTENRKKHKLDFEKATHGYREELVKTLNSYLDKVNSGEAPLIAIRDTPPEDHSEEYDIALKMLEMSVDQVIELSYDDFRHMVLDDWEWKRHWSVANSKYLGQ